MARRDVPPAEWLRPALRALAREEPLVFTRDGGKGVRAISRPRGLTDLPSHGVHANLNTEICIALEGEAVMTLEGRYYRFVPPMISVIASGARHSEGRPLASAPYALLWLSVAKSSLYLVVSRHTPRQGWDLPFRHVFTDASVPGLEQALSTEDLVRMRVELLTVLAALHRDLALYGVAHREAGQRQAMLRHVVDYLDSHLAQPLTLQQVASVAKLAPNYLNSLFREWKGMGIHHYLIERRMQKALSLVDRDGMAVKEIAAAVGYPDALYFSRAFHSYHGFWPSEARKRREGAFDSIDVTGSA